MPRDLIHLIRASGFSGVVGQNFLSHVTGAEIGIDMQMYHCDGWDTWTGEPDPEVISFPSGHVFNIGWTFVEGVMARVIRRVGAGVIDVSSSVGGVGSSFSAVASISSSSSDGSAALTILSRFNPDAITAPVNVTRAWYTGLADGDYPGGSGVGEVTFSVGTDYGAGSGIEYVDVVLQYGPIDIGDFNDAPLGPGAVGPLLQHYINDIPMADRAITNGDLTVEWSTDGVTNDYGSGLSVTWNQSFVSEDKTLYYRVKIPGGTFGAWHALNFVDPRPMP